MDERLRAADNEVQEAIEEAAQAVRDWQAANIAAGGVCDFCSRLLEGDWRAWRGSALVTDMGILDARTLGTGTITFVNDPYWAACEACDPVVEAGDPQALVEHVLATRDPKRTPLIPPGALPELRSSLRDLYGRLLPGLRRAEQP